MDALTRDELERVRRRQLWGDGTVGDVLTFGSPPAWAPPSGGGIDATDLGRPTSRDWVPGQSLYTDFSNQARTESVFDVVNATYGTDAADGSKTSITPTSTAVLMSVLAKSQYTFRDFDMRVRYRNPTTPHTSSDLRLPFRYLGTANYYYGYKSYGASPIAGIYRRLAAADSTLASLNSTSIDADKTAITPRIMRVQALGDLFRFKSWVEGTPEPDWQLSATINQTSGQMHEQGTAGLLLLIYDAGWHVTELTITEMLPNSDNLLVNSSLDKLDIRLAADRPAWWAPSTGGATIDTATADPYGFTRRLLKVTKAAADASTGWEQYIQTAMHNFNAIANRDRNPLPPRLTEFPAFIEVSGWSKGTSIAFNTPGSDWLGGALVLYEVDEYLAAAQQTANKNTVGLAPGDVVADSGTVGEGTWDWTFFRHRMQLDNPARLAYVRVGVYLHDSDVSGTLWVADLQVRPVF